MNAKNGFSLCCNIGGIVLTTLAWEEENCRGDANLSHPPVFQVEVICGYFLSQFTKWSPGCSGLRVVFFICIIPIRM